jgi:RNA polymerase sigma factor (sigma-70 family)
MAQGVPDDVDTYRRHAGELIRYATVLVGPDHAPDVVTDAVLAAFRSPQWRSVQNRRAYLFRAVLSHSASHHRSTARRRRREATVAQRASTTVEPTEPTTDAHRALATLSAQQRAIVYLTYWMDQSPAQIAELLAISEGAVRKQLARARLHLRRVLDA